MKVLTVVGARPQFIKAAVVSRILRDKHEEILIHTGQHYDYNMSEVFFKELDIPSPDYNLGISGGGHGKMTGEMLIELEKVMMKEKPDAVLVYGDTNSTMAAALAASKLHIPLIHVEAGNRLENKKNPEEINRIVTDHLSQLKLYCTESAKKYLEREGIADNSYLVGDPMYDAFIFYSKKVSDDQPEELIDIWGEKASLPQKFNYMTCHRQENTEDPNLLKNILDAMESLEISTIYPVHPRNKQKVKELIDENKYSNIIFVEPVGYLMSIYLMNNCQQVVTDSGGLQREAFFAGKQCVTVFDFVVWPETMIDNRNVLSKPDKDEIVLKLKNKQKINEVYPFGNGRAAENIVKKIEELME